MAAVPGIYAYGGSGTAPEAPLRREREPRDRLSMPETPGQGRLGAEGVFQRRKEDSFRRKAPMGPARAQTKSKALAGPGSQSDVQKRAVGNREDVRRSPRK